MDQEKKLVLLADKWTFAELKRADVLPASILTTGGGDPANPYPLDDSASSIVRLDPSWFIPYGDPVVEEANAVLNDERFDELFAGFLGKVICHVAVVDSQATGDEADDVAVRPMRRLASLRKWYELFNKLAAKHVGKRAAEYTHVLVLVVSDRIDPSQLEDFRYFVTPEDKSNGATKSFARTYVMLRRLEIGKDRALHARYVWPYYVGHLLTSLCADSSRLRQNGRALQTFVWRYMQVAPAINQGFCTQAVAAAFRKAYEKIAGNTDADEKNRPRLKLSFSGLEAIDKLTDTHGDLEFGETCIPTQHWHAYDATAEVQQAVRPENWRGQTTCKGRAALSDLTKSQLGTCAQLEDVPDTDSTGVEAHFGIQEDKNTRGIQVAWIKVHNSPRYAFARVESESRRDIATGDAAGNTSQEKDTPGLSQVFQQADLRWRELRQLEDGRKAHVKSLEEGAKEYQSAAQAHVEGGFRMLAVLAAVPLMGLLSFYAVKGWMEAAAAASTGRPLFGYTWSLPALVALIGAAGALLGAFLPWCLHNFCGGRAQGALQEAMAYHGSIVKARHRACIALMASGGTAWLNIRCRGMAASLRPLLERCSTMLNTELQGYQPASSLLQDGKSEDDPEADSNVGSPDGKTQAEEEREQRGRRQRRILREQRIVMVPQKQPVGDVDCGKAKALGEEVAVRESEVFLEKWRHNLNRWDTKSHGRIPARKLIPFLRTFRDRLESAVVASESENRLLALSLSKSHEQETVDTIVELTRHNETDEHCYFMSCILPEKQLMLSSTILLSDKLKDKVQLENCCPMPFSGTGFAIIYEEAQVTAFDLVMTGSEPEIGVTGVETK